MDAFSPLELHNPGELAATLGERVRWWRLSRGWTQQELAERAGIGLSTLKAMETKGKSTLLNLCRIATVLGIDSQLAPLFAPPDTMESIEAVKRTTRRRAPRKPKP